VYRASKKTPKSPYIIHNTSIHLSKEIFTKYSPKSQKYLSFKKNKICLTFLIKSFIIKLALKRANGHFKLNRKEDKSKINRV